MSKTPKMSPIPWDRAKPLIAKYENYYPIPEVFGNPQSNTLKNFYIYKQVFQNLKNNGACCVYVAFAYHENENIPNKPFGYSIVFFGVNNNNEIMFGPTDLIWDTLTNRYINLGDAKEIIKNYQYRYFVNTSFIDEFSGNLRTEILKGHTILESDLIKILDPNSSVDYIEFILAYHSSFKHDNHDVQIGHTWVVIRNINKTTSGMMVSSTDLVLDYCDPCPQKCPRNESVLMS